MTTSADCFSSRC